MKCLSVLAAAGMIALASHRADAASMSYTGSPIDKPNLTYGYHVDTSYKAFPLYGGPVNAPSNNALNFAGLKFVADSENGAAKDLADCQFSVTLTADPGQSLQSVLWTEGGAFDLRNTAGGTGNNVADIQKNNFKITVTAVAGVTLAQPLVNNNVAMTYPTGSHFQTADPGSDTGNWMGSTNLNLASIFGTNLITQVTIYYDTVLSAQSAPGGTAYIQKSTLGVAPTFAAVPEPSILSSIATAGLFLARRRRGTRH